jgi:hypothetical protein
MHERSSRCRTTLGPSAVARDRPAGPGSSTRHCPPRPAELHANAPGHARLASRDACGLEWRPRPVSQGRVATMDGGAAPGGEK